MNKFKSNDFYYYSIFILFIVIGFFLQAHMLPNNNVTNNMLGANIFLHGGNYFNFFEINPPSALFIYIPPMALKFKLNLFWALIIYVFALIIISITICHNLLSKYYGKNTYINLITLLLLFLLIYLPGYNFGEREYIAIILAMPYLFLAALRISEIQPPKFILTIIIGFFAGIAFTIKPYFIVAPLLIELFIIFKKEVFLLQ